MKTTVLHSRPSAVLAERRRMKRARKPKAIRKEARGTWVFFPVVNGKRTTRTLGLLKDLNQEQADRKAEETLRSMRLRAERRSPTVGEVVEQYRTEGLSKLRHSTKKAAESWLKVYVLPHWGEQPITDLQPRTVQLWLESLPLAGKTRGHIKGLLSRLVNYAMWAGLIPIANNPISLVTVKGSSKRKRKVHTLSVKEFHDMLEHLDEPFRTMMQVQLCLGLRVSELLALRWKDVDWIGSKLNVEHGIVNQHLDSVKTEGSCRVIPLDGQLVRVLQSWKQQTDFREAGDWIFASPVKLGRLPISYTAFNEALQRAGAAVGISRIATHSLRHTYRSWLDAVGTAITVQQRLMRHADIRTTLSYGETASDELKQANSKIARRAFDSGVIPEPVTQ
jgi:integrase